MACGLVLLFSTKQIGCHECPEEKNQRFQLPKDRVVQKFLDNSTNSVPSEQICTWPILSMFLVLLRKSAGAD
jgi:hypothetical protein